MHRGVEKKRRYWPGRIYGLLSGAAVRLQIEKLAGLDLYGRSQQHNIVVRKKDKPEGVFLTHLT